MTDRCDILIIDDESLDRELVRRLLPADCTVREAATIKEARAELARGLPRLVLLDNRLPDGNGVDVVADFVAHHVPVVMLTEVEAPDVIVVAMQRGAEDYLVKGALTRDRLSRTIDNAMEKSALHRRLDEQHHALAEQAETLEVRNREIRSLATALTLAEQAERHRIAELLHDDVQQLLVGAQLHLELLQGSEPARQTEVIGTVRKIVDKAISCTRDLVAELTPPVLDDDLEVALLWLADHMSRLHQISVVIEAETPGWLPSRDLRVLVIQIARELVFNAVKHAGVAEVRVRLYDDVDTVVVVVEDAGSGFDQAEAQTRPRRGFGLHSVAERLKLIGGHFDLDSRVGQGTRATITVPVSCSLTRSRSGRGEPV